MKNRIVEPSDPRLTAYVVGEMTPEASAAFEMALENSPAARDEIERIRETADLLREEFGAELDAAFTPREPVAISPLRLVEGGNVNSVPERFGFLPEMRTAIGALAAVLVAIAVVTVTWMKRGNESGDPEINLADSGGRIEAGNEEAITAPRSTAPAAEISLTPEPAEVFDSANSWSVLSAEESQFPPYSLASVESDDLLAGTGRFLGDDPAQTRGRILSEDPIVPQPILLPSTPGVPIPARTGAARTGAASVRGPGVSSVPSPYGYRIEGLDPNVANADRYLEFSGQVSGDGSGEITRSLYVVDKSTDENGNASVRLKGRIHVEDHGGMVVAEVTGSDGKVTVGKARKADKNPETGEVLLTGGPPFLEMGNQVIRPQSGESKIVLKPDGTHLVTGRNQVKFQLAGVGAGGGAGSPAEIGADKPSRANLSETVIDPTGPRSIETGFSAAMSSGSGASNPGATGGSVSTRRPVVSPGPDSTSAPAEAPAINFTTGENDAVGAVDTLGSQLDAGLSMSHAATGVVQPGVGIEMRWVKEELPPAPSKSVSGRGKFARTFDNPFKDPMTTALSTFSVDVDTASYTEVRRMILKDGQLPDRDQVRIEEFVNYFNYDSYKTPDLAVAEEDGQAPFSVNLECAAAPWNPANRIVRIGLKGADIPAGERPAANLVFLLDVSGSMSPEDKLPLMQKCLRELVPNLRKDDRVTMVVYASKAGEVLAPTAGNDSGTILDAVNALTAKGSTNGEGGIQIAYERARENFIEDGVNRILLATDGDFNVGQDSDDGLVRLIEKEAKSGIDLTVLGFGTGNLNDSMLEKITNKGNGQFHYIDRLEEGRRVLVEGMNGSLVTIAKDVKIQVEFNAGKVAAYRLIGYGNRVMPREDFNDDSKDAGEIGAGHTVTALYEVVPVEEMMHLTRAEPVDELKYKKLAGERKAEDESPFEKRRRAARKQQGVDLVESPELLTVKLRFKRPDADESEPEIQFPLVDPQTEFADASADLRFATAVGAFGEWLRVSPASGSWNVGGTIQLDGNRLRVPIQQGRSNHQLEKIARIANDAIEGDEFERKKELVEMVKAAAKLNGGSIDLGTGEGDPAPEDPARGGVGNSVKEKLKQLR